MKNTIVYLFLFIGIGFIFSSCYKDNEEELYPLTLTCDTTNVTYSASVAPIVSKFCSACHGVTSFTTLGGNIQLDTYTELTKYVNDKRFLNSVLQNGEASLMPLNATKLNECNIKLIETWINDGAKNN